MGARSRPYIADFILSAALIGIGLFVVIESLKLRPSPYEPLGPAFLPRALSVSLMVLAIPVLVQGFQKWRRAASRAAVPAAKAETAASTAGPVAETGTGEAGAELTGAVVVRKRPLLTLFTGILAMVYIASIRLVGFRLSTVVLVLVLGSALYRRERKGRPVPFFATLVVLAFGMSQLLFFVFTRILVVNLP